MAVTPNALKKWEKARDHAPGKAGRVRVPPEPRGALAAEPLCDRVRVSYRAVAPKRPTSELDTR